MDIVYIFRHSRFHDVELRFSLRSVAKYFPDVGNVWIFGDRPTFLSDDASLVQQVLHTYTSRIAEFPNPVRNLFQLIFLASLIPELNSEFLFFSDDFILLEPLTVDEARKVRFLENLDGSKTRGRGVWNDGLWRTYELLKRLRYPGYNFETHVPAYLTKKRVFEAYAEFRDFTTNDWHQGLYGLTAILNHAYHHHGFELTDMRSEDSRAGFWHKRPSYEEVASGTHGKRFLNFDDAAFGPAIVRFLREQFPEKSCYEAYDLEFESTESRGADDDRQNRSVVSSQRSLAGGYPKAIIPHRKEFGRWLSEQGLTTCGVVIGSMCDRYARQLVAHWPKGTVHCLFPLEDSATTRSRPTTGDESQPQPAEPSSGADSPTRTAQSESRIQSKHLSLSEMPSHFQDRSLDFIYFDAAAPRVQLWEALDRWHIKIRPGGYLAGHVYVDGVLPQGTFEMKSDIDAWAARKGLHVACSGEPTLRSWFIRIP